MNDLKYRVTAFVDGELTNEISKLELLQLIESNPELQAEFELQRFTKLITKNKCTFKPTPDSVKRRIIKQISPEENSFLRLFPNSKKFLSKPALAVSGVFAIIAILLFLIINKYSEKNDFNFAAEQNGPNNIFIQASTNFDNIIHGKLAPQILTDNPGNIKSFFEQNGVKYSTLVPQMENWKIIGAVVSEGAGEKFAHHVYSNKDGKLVYVFQVAKFYINKCQAAKLSNHLLNYLEAGNCYVSEAKGYVTLMKKMESNICTVVSNSSRNEIENLFCSK
ncbi:MAG: hypothetical protein HXY50_16595 [Ignavibacteriaceae bacterium]|nr:hypothetical protein [Ignavibacteriaceae bacterium]